MIASGFFLDAPRHPLSWRGMEIPVPGPAEALVEITACGLCHTDLSYASGSVAPRHELPLVLGHEITGVVVDAGADCRELAGTPVLVPSVLPCGECDLCRAGRSNICQSQKMPGNDIHGGFATHLIVPGRFLVALDPGLDAGRRAEIAVVADAVSTAHQALRRGRVEAGDAVFVVGAGGVGAFVAQLARARGARTIACDLDPDRLGAAAAHGAEATVEIDGQDERQLRKQLQSIARGWGIPSVRWRIFECSGTPDGQRLAFSLLAAASTMVQIGYTHEKIELRLSNLMAYDAEVHGTWGCPPEEYPTVLDLIYRGEVVLEPFVDHAPMSDLNRLLEDMAAHRLQRRMILHPEH